MRRFMNMKTRPAEPSTSVRRVRPRMVALAGLLLLLPIAILVAAHELDLFELEGNVADDVAAGEDWALLDDGVGDPSNDDTAQHSVFVFDDGIDGVESLREELPRRGIQGRLGSRPVGVGHLARSGQG